MARVKQFDAPRRHHLENKDEEKDEMNLPLLSLEKQRHLVSTLGQINATGFELSVKHDIS